MIKMLNKGFTLIDLMVVAAIIGILAAIVIPNFILYKEKYEQGLKNDKQLEQTIDLNEPKDDLDESKEDGSTL